MKRNIYISLTILLFSCSSRNGYLRETYRKDFNLDRMYKLDSLDLNLKEKLDCENINKQNLNFKIKNEDSRKTLASLYFNIYLNNRRIFSGFYNESITTQPLDICTDKNKGTYVWFAAFDTVENVYYTWGQKNSIPMKSEYRIGLLYQQNSNGDNYVVE